MDVHGVWNECFGEVPPVGYLMRRSLPDRWLRVHSLPGSKRYPENELEYSVLLNRHAQVSCEVLGQDKSAILFAPLWDTDDLVPSLAEFDWALRAGLTHTNPMNFPPSEPGEPPIRIAGCAIPWSDQLWLDLLRDVADDRISVVLLNSSTNEAYAPYDGGADLFLANQQRVETLKRRWSAWLSTHPAGL